VGQEWVWGDITINISIPEFLEIDNKISFLGGGTQRPLMSVFEIFLKLTLSLMVINGHLWS
jgi:hypothetical protein